MSSDPNKKSARSFQCRDVLWETFEQMARELECSVDYLINEAMKQYARQRSYGTRTPFPGARAEAAVNPASTPGFAPPAAPAPMAPPAARSTGLTPPPARMPPPPMRGGSSLPLPPPPTGARTSSLPMPPPAARQGQMPAPPGRTAPPPGPRSVPPPLPRGGAPQMPPMQAPAQNGFPNAASHASTLSVVYQNEKFPVTKDRFVIGRGKQSSDLTLKDPNVSRQHAMVEFQNGVYFMVDMGSTNGVEYNGQRIARKQIAEGDVFRICDHDLVFTYR
jgi:hypothetical protein